MKLILKSNEDLRDLVAEIGGQAEITHLPDSYPCLAKWSVRQDVMRIIEIQYFYPSEANDLLRMIKETNSWNVEYNRNGFFVFNETNNCYLHDDNKVHHHVHYWHVQREAKLALEVFLNSSK